MILHIQRFLDYFNIKSAHEEKEKDVRTSDVYSDV